MRVHHEECEYQEGDDGDEFIRHDVVDARSGCGALHAKPEDESKQHMAGNGLLRVHFFIDDGDAAAGDGQTPEDGGDGDPFCLWILRFIDC